MKKLFVIAALFLGLGFAPLALAQTTNAPEELVFNYDTTDTVTSSVINPIESSLQGNPNYVIHSTAQNFETVVVSFTCSNIEYGNDQIGLDCGGVIEAVYPDGVTYRLDIFTAHAQTAQNIAGDIVQAILTRTNAASLNVARDRAKQDYQDLQRYFQNHSSVPMTYSKTKISKKARAVSKS
jgi:hypothetical protein